MNDLTLPAMTEVSVRDIVAGDAVWSRSLQQFFFVIATARSGWGVEFTYLDQTGDTFEPRDRILRADRPSAAEIWNIEQSWRAA